MSRSSKNRLRVASEIERLGQAVALPCDYCSQNEKLCIAMESSSVLKCSECVRRGKPCVNMTWASLDESRDKIQKKIDADEVVLAEVLGRLLRNKKLLRSINAKAQKKTECLAQELEEVPDTPPSNDVFIEDCPAAAATVGLSPLTWETLASLEEFVH